MAIFPFCRGAKEDGWESEKKNSLQFMPIYMMSLMNMILQKFYIKQWPNH